MSTLALDLTPEPDVKPLYPTKSAIEQMLSPNSGLTTAHKSTLVRHSILRACTFGDLGLLSYLLSDPLAGPHIDLDVRDEDGLGLISVTILGFGGDPDRDVDREECVRLLIAEGANVTTPDDAGWTPLHHAALLSPPTLVSHLITHGSSPLTLTNRQLTPLDIITGHSLIPGRDDVALLLKEAMSSEGWKGGRRQEQRKRIAEKENWNSRRVQVRTGVGKVLGLEGKWWGDDDSDATPDASDNDENDEGYDSDTSPTPLPTYETMLVFSPPSLPQLFYGLITIVKPSLRHSEPAKALYLHARFACIACDHNWLEDLLVGAVDKIEEAAYAKPDDLPRLAFWLFNVTTLLHLLRCDADVSETCDILGLFNLIEELVNVIYVFIIRVVERRIDTLLDLAILEHSPLASEFESLQFESEWSFLRSFTSPKKKPPPSNIATSAPSNKAIGTVQSAQSPSTMPPSPQPQMTPSGASRFSSLRQSLSRNRPGSTTGTPVSAVFGDANPTPLQDLTTLLTALHNLLTMSGINPALVTQTFSQVMYWTSCEIFNRVLTRKKYICRSRAVQIGLNLGVIEEWVLSVGLPRGVSSHFGPVRELLGWLQCLSSIGLFANLVATIQTMKSLNPLQMRRAVRDYRYEVGEGRMSEECSQYLAQLQKDWERRRVKLGVEAIRKEIGERERDQDESISSQTADNASIAPSVNSISEIAAQKGVDFLFSRNHDKSDWVASRAPEVLGELLDARYMLPLALPSDPHFLSALPLAPMPMSPKLIDQRKRESFQPVTEERSSSRASNGARGAMEWRSKQRKLRQVSVDLLEWVDRAGGQRRFQPEPPTGATTVNGDVDQPPPPPPKQEVEDIFSPTDTESFPTEAATNGDVEEAQREYEEKIAELSAAAMPQSPQFTHEPAPRKERRNRGSSIEEPPLPKFQLHFGV